MLNTKQYAKEIVSMGKFKSCDMWEWRVSNKEGVARFARYIYEDTNIFLSRKYNYAKENMLI